MQIKGVTDYSKRDSKYNLRINDVNPFMYHLSRYKNTYFQRVTYNVYCIHFFKDLGKNYIQLTAPVAAIKTSLPESGSFNNQHLIASQYSYGMRVKIDNLLS